ncbi:large conductance mechanosensitive channel protein MscL [Spirosoma utsteinense]|uniref:Large-conductance mechanosensitive channel n=1 Tax=Spirosoma utsteinense TaxID=2585773 RepID=A0ABR6W904_9BACT|nr:large conductance mechanosensitive channel protein MscL [Spirosoma utsteinense]MBC3786106.1 large conductance mechanosensitive channel [Spirosoma utsteinense]MBC3792295.1 large conductance mechanosensitive channel [Spirosoma utsteinense]
MLSEFKAFIAQGNVLDLAVGIIIGAAFTKIINSLVEDILNPILGLALGGVDLTQFKIVIKEAVGTIPEVAIRYGNFLNAILQFLIVAGVIFMIVKAANRSRLSKSAEA